MGGRDLALLEEAILHEDRDLLVLDKPAGIAVHGGSGVSFGVIEALRRLRGEATLELVHRLDRDTSGCLLVAKRRPMLRALHAQLRSGTLIKTYSLIVHGSWPEGLERVDAPLTRFHTVEGERRVKVDPAGKPSLSEFEVTGRAPAATLLTARLHTGRTHQIRVHARHGGHSIVGDEKYADSEQLAGDRALGIRRLCLHASSVVLEGEAGTRTFEAPLPAAFRAAWRVLETAEGG